MIKLFDKFLKVLKTDRNTFWTFILTLISIYFAVDRLIEILLMIFTGISYSYWGPIMYTVALLCPIFAFLFCYGSKFVKNNKTKEAFFDLYVIGLYIIFISMLIQWTNRGIWSAMIQIPNYSYVATNFPEVFRPALSSIAIAVPIMTIPRVFKFLYMGVNDTRLWQESIWDFGGIKLTPNTKGRGNYACEINLTVDKETAKKGYIPEQSRFEQLLVVGPSGSGKTSLVFEPMMAQDISKKYFFNNVAKELGFTALKTGIATLRSPYNNDYINKNFSLYMLEPVDGKIAQYKKYLGQMIVGEYDGKLIYKDLGLTSISPDYESTSRMIKVAKAHNFNYNLVDPNQPADSVGLNPFVFANPLMTADVLTQLLKAMNDATKAENIQEKFVISEIEAALKHTCCFLKDAFPLLYEDKDYLPTVQDIVNIFNEPALIEEMYKRIKQNPDNADKLNSDAYMDHYKYFAENFFKNGENYQNSRRGLHYASEILHTLIANPGVKDIICKRTHNMNYDTALSHGEITLICTERGDLGANPHRAFGIFIILLMQNSILRRPGSEDSRIPHFLYIDEFPDFMSTATDPIFTLYRKYRVGTSISSQSIFQFGDLNSRRSNLILSNCVNKIVFGNLNVDETTWWSKEMGNVRRWVAKRNYDTAKGEYESKLSDIGWNWVARFAVDKVRAIPFKTCLYTLKDENGAKNVGEGKLDFMAAKYSEKKTPKMYNFTQYSGGHAASHSSVEERRTLRNPHIEDNTNFEIDPIQTDHSGLVSANTDGDAIISGKKKNKKN